MWNWRVTRNTTGMHPSGMWHSVHLVLTDVSEEPIASIFRVEKSASEEPTWSGGSRLQSVWECMINAKNVVFWDVASCRSCVNERFGGMYRLHLHGRKNRELQSPAYAGPSLTDFSTLKIEAIHSSETSVHTRSTQLHIQEEGILQSPLSKPKILQGIQHYTFRFVARSSGRSRTYQKMLLH
jgi:hypothetical protein